MRFDSCIVCGTKTPVGCRRCPRCALPKRARGRSFDRVRLAVAERDRWTCAGCLEQIDPALRRPHPRALHVDHKIPLAAGGTDDPSNLAAMHADCNLRKGASRDC